MLEGSKTHNSGHKIRVTGTPVQVPAPPKIEVRREGFWGKPNLIDQEESNRLRGDFLLAVRSAYVDRCAGTLAVHGHRSVTSATLEMEDEDDSLPLGSLARQLGSSLTAVDAQVLGESHVSNLQNFVQTALARLRRD
jgi:hypothetical protein